MWDILFTQDHHPNVNDNNSKGAHIIFQASKDSEYVGALSLMRRFLYVSWPTGTLKQRDIARIHNVVAGGPLEYIVFKISEAA